MTQLNRRRFLSLSACALASCAAPVAFANASSVSKVTWQGWALGADINLTLYAEDEIRAQKTLAKCHLEIKRLEKIFSLFQRESEIVLLNKHKKLKNPSAELKDILNIAQDVSSKTDGIFDVTVQPLWSLFRRASFHGKIPMDNEIDEALSKIGWQYLEISSGEIRFSKPDMSITLNGIAQGYITDRITSLLENDGFGDVLVNMGEWRGVGGHPDQSPWNILLPSAQIMPLKNKALATSSGSGLAFYEKHESNHLFNPNTALSPALNKHISVMAETACLADALSTSLCIANDTQAEMIKRNFPEIQVFKAVT